MPPKRLVALTHCIRSAIQEGDWKTADLLLSQRRTAVRSMVEQGSRLSQEERSAIGAADDLLLEALAQRKEELSGRLRHLKVSRRVLQTYRRA